MRDAKGGPIIETAWELLFLEMVKDLIFTNIFTLGGQPKYYRVGGERGRGKFLSPYGLLPFPPPTYPSQTQ